VSMPDSASGSTGIQLPQASAVERGAEPQATERLFIEALTEALIEEMEADERVFILGEDVAEYGGAFKVTKGLVERFGPERVINTPISETAIVGAAIGAALMGMRPVAEMQYIDFITQAFDQLVTEAGKMYYRTGQPVPIVVRGASGAGVRAGPFHSAQPEAFFCHAPGLKVVAPATAYDAKGLLKAAIRDENPVIFLEHKLLYRRVRDPVPTSDYVVELGKARIHRPGRDLVCITYGAQVHTAAEAAEELASEGIEMEVLDLRTLQPLDVEAIVESVSRCHRVLVCHEANPVCGVGSEVAAVIADAAFEYLDAPIRRVTSPHTPVPYAPVLEDAYVPGKEAILKAARALLEW
jgi:pyruvate/2-oxoglutarate/acetoin dehydrogenase E1 component